MTNSAPAQTHSLTVRRTIEAPRERVFHAWSDPEALKQWWCRPGVETPSAEVDLRVGGRYRLGMRRPADGESFSLSGVFQEVTPPERLVYTWLWKGQNPETHETLVTVEFKDRGEKTEVVLTHERFPDVQMRDQHNQGWNDCLDSLDRLMTPASG